MKRLILAWAVPALAPEVVGATGWTDTVPDRMERLQPTGRRLTV